MSAFLGPIHFWLYNKIQIQNDIIKEIIEAGKDVYPNLEKELDSKYGTSENRPLEEVIDEKNIHGWLQNQIVHAEYKLAYSVITLMNRDPVILEKIKTIFMKEGGKKSTNTGNAIEAYKIINDSLLDGMPCDNVNTVIKRSEEEIVWKRNSCVHRSYWDELKGDINIYYFLREQFMEGVLKGSPLVHEKVDELTSMIRRR